MSATTRTQTLGLAAGADCGSGSSTATGDSILRSLAGAFALFFTDDGVLKPTPKSLNCVASLSERTAKLPVAVTHTLWPSDTAAVHHVRPDR